ncbi:MAG: hypothetical protein DI623_12350 [Sphingomonas sanxanigenens]|uniref:Host-nuclease inhibitor protein Gam n=1 Tax=Sphingomonas sanxanigenens TaxID=397260 RepID=A0A2W5C3D6_9SPHN|nr:MAG: hypothetical protein DI623_12350 [Sphingomonas sanxanigenens]
MARRTATAVDLPKSVEEAAGLLGRYAALTADIAAIDAERAIKRAEIDQDADERIARREEELKAIFARLKPWWAVAGDQVTGGKKRSAELGGCDIGIRTTPPRLVLQAKEPEMIRRLQGLRWSRVKEFLRTKVSLDKQAIIKEIGTGKDGHLGMLGFTTRQTDEFFIAPIAPEHEPGDSEDVANG